MAYKADGDEGTVVCDHCGMIIDEGLTYEEYLECYGGQKKDYCGQHFKPETRKRNVKKEVDDGE